MSDDALEVAQQILALVDESPSGPFSLERRFIEEQVEALLMRFADIAEEAKESYYELGYDDGFDEGHSQGSDSAEEEIQSLEERVEELEGELEDLNDKIDQAFAEGYEAGNRMNDSVEDIKFS